MKRILSRISAIVSLLLLTFLPSSAQSYRYFSLSRHNFVDTIKVQIWKGAVVIPVEIEGSVKNFLFDTGAQMGLWVGEEEPWMKVLPNDSLTVRDIHMRTKKKAVYQIPSIKLGNTYIKNYPMILDDGLSDYSCGIFDGALSFDIVAIGLLLKLDTKDSLLIVTDKKGFFDNEEKRVQPLSVTPKNFRPAISVDSPFGCIEMILDLGNVGGWINLPQNLINIWKGEPDLNRKVNELTVQTDTTMLTGAGLFGFSTDTVVETLLHIPEISVGGLTIKDLWTSTANRTLCMGSAILEHTSLIIDPYKQCFFFLPHDGNPEIIAANEGEGDYSFAPAGDTKGGLKAIVRKGSKPYQKGMRTGDYLISINGKPMPDMCSYILLKQKEKVQKMTLRSAEGVIKEVTL
ncbi:MAG: hypothetical protein K6A41_01510 [Bacteroidales bacterium]|nr:hypothetical protein [Bacteroidales bacterium]